jgi:adhesin/invasin
MGDFSSKGGGGLAMKTHCVRALVCFGTLVLICALSACSGVASHTAASQSPALTPAFSLSASSVSFGNQTAATPKTVTVTNTGLGNLVISGLTIAGANAAEFSASAGTLPLSVGPGSSAPITLTFTPTVPGSGAATLSIVDNASGSPHTVALSGMSLLQDANAFVSLSPNSGQAGTTVTINIQGTLTDFAQGSAGVAGTNANFGPGIVVGAGDGLVTVNSPTSATVQVQVGTQAAPGPRQIVVSTGGHYSAATFQVLPSGSGPVANAGPAQFAAAGNTVRLDGSHSTCVSGASGCLLNFEWTFLSEPSGSTATLTNPTSVYPSFTIDQPGNYTVQLQASSNGVSQSVATPLRGAAADAASSTASVVSTLASVTISTQNTSPIADAGPDQFVLVDSKVQLDGSGSSDVDGDALTYQWAFVSMPAGSAAVLSNATAVAPTFVADKDGAYVLQLTVNDGQGNTATSSVEVSTQPMPPIANAGPDQHVNAGESVQLDGSQSTAPDGDTLTYLWSFTFLPSNSTAVLTGATTAAPSFTADQPGAYGLQLIVTDSHNNSSVATVMVTTDAIQPVAVAGIPQQLPTGSTVQLDGSQSTGAPTSYQWTLISKPAASAATLSNPSEVKPTFVADQPGYYVPQLIVSDGELVSAPSTVLITATIAGFAVSPSAANFPNQVVNTTSSSLPVVITNSGTGNLDISSLKISGTNGGDFALASAILPITVAPGDTTTVNLTFTPAALGSRAAMLTINDNAPGSPHSVALSGTGVVGPPASVAPVAGTPQSAMVDTAFSTPLQVVVTDASGDPLSGVPVVFTLPPTGASGTFAGGSGAAMTNALGVATAPAITANGTLGSYTATATVAGVATPANFALSNLTGLPASVTATAGTPQSAVINAVYATALQAVVKDAGGNPVSGVVVTFVAPAGKASGAFAGGVNTATTNSQGLATAPAFTANGTAGGYSVNATVSGVSTAAVFALTNLAGPPAGVTATAGTPQSGAVNTAFATALQATVKDAGGNPVSGTTVTFAVPGSGPSGTFAGGLATAQAITNAAGQATAPALTANSKAGGPYNVTASVTGVGTPAVFALTNLAGAASSVVATAGSAQSVAIDGAFAVALQVTVTDASGNPVSGTVVTFTAPAGGASGTFAGGVNTATTNAQGVATAQTFTANSTAGSYSVSATVAGVTTPAGFTLTNLTGPAAGVTATAGTPQSAAINTAFGTQLQATVKDAGGNPVGGTTVTFIVPATGASASFAGGLTTVQEITNSSGHATAPVLTANSKAGGPYNVIASVTGISTPASFALTNLAGAPSSVSATAGTPQSAAINTAFAATLQATVTDIGGNPVSGVVVTFAVPGSGPSGTFAGGVTSVQETTNAAGQATSSVLTANNKAGGPYNVTASAAGVSAAANFALINLTGAPSSIVVTTGNQQSVTINGTFTTALQATVTDAGGNPLNGAAVTFTAPGSGAGGTFAGGTNAATTTTNAQGVATAPAFTANGTAGNYTVAASVAGVTAPASFTLTNLAGPPASVTATGGTPQSVAINGAFAPLQATVKDAGGNPVAGAAVTFAAPGSGAGGTFASGGNPATTNAQGVATAPVFTANGIAGSYTVTATVAGVSGAASFALTNLAGPPASIAATAGSGQSVTINSGFATALQATVKDAGGNLVSGVTVSFTAPGSGASGTFAGGASSATATTNAQGVATAPAFTANSTAGAFTVSAAVTGVSSSANFAMTVQAGPAASVSAAAGSGQSATIGSGFATVLQAAVKDAGGNPVSGATVNFTAPASGASGTFAGGVSSATATTNAQGLANAPAFTANSTAGAFAVTAAVAGVTTPASFALTNQAGPPAGVTATAGTPQSAAINVGFKTALQAMVKDAGGNGVGGVTVTFTAPANGASGTFAGDGNLAAVSTNAQGIATAPALTANATAGNYNITASVAGVSTPASFSLTNLAGQPASVTATAGTPQGVSINTVFSTAMQATVKDASGNGVSGVIVTFAAPASGASGTFAGGVNTATTNAQGVAAAATFTANGTAGSYTVTATVAGVPTPANFLLTNQAGPPASVTATAGTPQSEKIGTVFAAAMQATVKDASGNPVGGATVTFAAPASGASGTFAGGSNTATTNAQGVATAAAFTANGTAGGYLVTASVAGVTTPADFALTNLAGPAAAIAATAGSGQSATIGASFVTALQATVTDSGGNAVSGVTVSFAAPAGGASGTFAGGVGTATTNAQGVATAAVFTANNTAGSYTVTASVAGVATAASFTLTNLAGAPASVTATAGTPQSVAIDTAFAVPLQVTVKDASSNPVSGVTVTFAAPATGAGGSFAGGLTTATTNAQGVATAAVFTANGKAGAYTVTASVAGVTTPASFALTNRVGPAASVTATAGTPQSITINNSFPAPLQATVTDAGGNAVSGATVTFAALATGASGTFAGGVSTAMAATNAQGVANSPVFTANGTGGSYTVSAGVSGVTTPASFALTNLTPTIGINPGSVSFGNELLGTTSAATPVTISNTGAGNLVITGLGITGSNTADFAFTAGTLPITVAPNGSTTVNVTFSPTQIQSRSAALTITDNASTSPQSVALTGTGTAPFIGINPTSVSFGNQLANVTSAVVPVTISNSNLANANLVISNLQISGTNAVEFAFTAGTLPITLAPNSSTIVNVTFTPAAAGMRSANLVITDNDKINFGGSPHSVGLSGNGIAPSISIPASVSFSSQLVNTTSAATNVTVADNGTANVVIYGVSVTGANASEFAYSGVQQLTITPGNSTPLAITFTPLGSGARSATLNILDNLNGGTQQNPHTDTVALSGTGIVLGTLIMPAFSVGTDLEVLVAPGLGSNAVASTSLPVTVTSPDTTKVLLSTSATQAGTGSVVVNIPQNFNFAFPGIYVQSLDVPSGAPDTIQLSVTAPGYAAITCTVTLTPSALVLSGPQGIGQNFSTTESGTVPLSVGAYGLGTNGNISGTQQQLAGGLSLNVSVTSSDASVGTILNSPAVLAGGSSGVSGLSFQPAGAGNTLLTVVQPTGFTTPASGAQLTALVGAPQILLNPVTVGYQLQVVGGGQLSDPAPAGGLSVTISSLTPGTAQLSTSQTAAGSSSIVVTVPAGTTNLPTFYVQGLSVGTGQLQASAAGYNFSTGNSNGGVAITPSGFVIAGPSGVAGQSFSTTTITGTTQLTLTLMRLDPTNHPAVIGQLMGGGTASVAVTSGTPSFGSIVDSPAVFTGGESTNSLSPVLFSPASVGSTVLSVVQPAGFSTPTSGGQLTAVVSPPQITFSLSGTNVGENLQLLGSASLNAPAPSGGLTVTITSSDSTAVLLSPVATTQGLGSMNVVVPPGSGLNGVGFPQFYIQALQSSGSVTLTASASGWVPGTITVNLTPSGFVLVSPNGIGQDFGTLLSQGVDTSLNVEAMQLSSSGAPQTEQSLRGGVTENVTVISGSTSVGTIVGSPVTISGGTAIGSVSFQPAGVGVSTLSVSAPGGFATPSSGASLHADVN